MPENGAMVPGHSSWIIAGLPIPFVSVIIPVFKDSKRLETCLRALENQSYPRSRYEVIVVDNGPDENIGSVVSRFRGLQVRRVIEERAGSYAARNKGLSVAVGEVVAFTDSDCIPASDWIWKGVENLLEMHNPGFVTGGKQLFPENPRKPTAVELYDIIVNLKREMRTFATTANLFTLRSVFAKVGLFDGNLMSRGDFEWGQRVSSFGYESRYADTLCVAHPARRSLGEMYRRVARLQGGVHEYSRTHAYSSAASVENLFSSIRGTVVVCLHGQLSSVQKAKVLFVVCLAKYFGLLEWLRLRLGGKPRR